jgi:DNA helicase-2/ATP-dependent DNA helicase PcrA
MPASRGAREGDAPHLARLNAAQRAAAVFGIADAPGAGRSPPLLIIAGAGTGKTQTLTHRVAHLLVNGARPERILLLTFARRMAAEMIRRVEHICAGRRQAGAPIGTANIEWAGTFHAVGARLLRLHATAIGLDPDFSILDRADAEDLMDLVRDDLGFSHTRARFPKKATCLSIYSHCVNAQSALDKTLAATFPWCADWRAQLSRLFGAYVEAKQRQNALDYDDLLLYWSRMMAVTEVAQQVAGRFDHVLVDEYQDTNALQAQILVGLSPSGAGLTVVGDDAQAIYGFRAATVRNILDFPRRFDPPAATLVLEENFRSSQPILDACNAVIGHAAEGYGKRLHASRAGGGRPILATCADEAEQVDFVIDRVLANREQGMDLRDQAVLMRASHHSAQLELELTRRRIPFVKYGGLKFLEAAHVKDVIALLRWATNPRDEVAALRVLKLLPGVGPAAARRAFAALDGSADFGTLGRSNLPPRAHAHGEALGALLASLHRGGAWPAELDALRGWYDPLLEINYEAVEIRRSDLDQLVAIAAGHPGRRAFLTDLALDPPQASGAHAGAPLKDEDWLILSTIHSAKGQEWRAVTLLNVVDGCIPSDLATGSVEEVEEERRLLYVAMTRARDDLVLMQPLRFAVRGQSAGGDRHVYAPRTRFIAERDLDCFEVRTLPRAAVETQAVVQQAPVIDLKAAMRSMWSD